MKYNLKRVLAFVLAMMLTLACFTGCQYADETKDSNTVAMIVDGENYYMDEFKLYTYLAQNELEDIYSIMILYYYGGYDTFWQQDWAEALSTATSKLYQTKALCKYAAENNITLSQEELDKVKETIASFKENQKKIVEYSGATDELIEKYFTENALANKVYMEMVKDVDKNFDEATFRRKKIEGVTVQALTEKPAEETTEDEEAEATEAEKTADDAEPQGEAALGVAAAPAPGNEIDDTETVEAVSDDAESLDEGETEETVEEIDENAYTEEEQEAARKEAMEDIEARLKAGEEISDIVSSYIGHERVSVTEIADGTITPEDAAEEGADITSYRQKAWTMATGEIACEIYTDENVGDEMGYCLRSVNDDDPDLRKEAEDAELDTRQKKLFGEKYEPIAKKTKEFHIYEEKVVSAVKYKGQIHDSITVTGDDMDELESLEEQENQDETGEENAEEK